MDATDCLILYERDEDGVPYAVEEVHAARWDPALVLPPDPSQADVRVVHLARGPLPTAVPAWMTVHLRSGVAEESGMYEAPYVANGRGSAGSPRRGAAGARHLWPSSPHHREPRAALADFMRAGAAALRHPDPPPAEAERQAEALRAFARGREALAPLVSLRATALERWLHVAFREPEGFADAILLARIEMTAPADAALLRTLREAHVPRDAEAGRADLAIDREVLLAQASPWRRVAGDPMPAALAAVRAWQRRYARAYTEHYRRAIAERDRALRDAEDCIARLETLEHLNDIHALGPPAGQEAAAAARASVAALAALPDRPDPDAAVTGGVRLGEPALALAAFRGAAREMQHALEGRLRRLAAALAGCALEARDDDLQGVLDAIALSEVDHLDRVLDARLVTRIEALLGGVRPSPLAAVARQFPEVTLANLEAAVDEFRRSARAAIDRGGGRVVLGGAPPA